jgi:hypothetical protein
VKLPPTDGRLFSGLSPPISPIISPVNAPRYPFTIDRDGDSALISMHCDGFVRCRTMPLYLLGALVRACNQIRTHLVSVLACDERFTATVPPYPSFVDCMHFDAFAGVCDVHVVASRDGALIEFCAAFFDAGDRSAPAFVLVGDQLDEFVRKGQLILRTAAVAP